MTIIPRKPSVPPKAGKDKAKKLAAKKTAAKPPVKKAAAKKIGAKKAAAPKKAAAKKVGAKQATVKKAVAKKGVVNKTVVAKKAALAKKAPAKRPAAPKAKKPAKALSPTEQLLAQIKRILDDGKAEDIVAIDMAGKSAIADYMVIATGRSQRQLGALAENLRAQLKMTGKRVPQPEGMGQGDWVLLDAGDVVVHLFRPEVRGAYNLEKMWSQPFAESASGMEGLVKERPATPQFERAAANQPRRPDFRKRGSRRRR
ncbi:MAG: ribosome silencing factor [Alphaproteobacteria bacterium]